MRCLHNLSPITETCKERHHFKGIHGIPSFSNKRTNPYPDHVYTPHPEAQADQALPTVAAWYVHRGRDKSNKHSKKPMVDHVYHHVRH